MTATPTKGYLLIEPGSDKIEFLFNPAQLQVQLSSGWRGVCGTGQSAPSLTYEGGGSAQVTFTLTLDTTSTGQTVTTYTDQLASLLQIDTTLPGYDAEANNGRPRWVELHWGNTHFVRSVVTSLTVTFTYFDRYGTPLRATAALTLQQYAPDTSLPLQNPTSFTPDIHSTHQVRTGETLDRIAALVYGDPSQWRRIALANRVVNPFDLAPGTVLAIPKAAHA